MRDYRDLDVTISRGGAEHVLEWAGMRAALWPNSSKSDHADELDDMLRRSSDAELGFVAQLPDGSLAGFAEASLRRDYVNGCSSSPVLFLEGIYVKTEVRRKGVGRALFEAVRAAGRALGCAEFASDALIENVSSHSFHRALGFEETERVVFFHQSL